MTVKTTQKADSVPRSSSLGLQLLVLCPDAVSTIPLPDRGQLTIGRAPNAQVRIVDALASRKHGLLYLSPDGCAIEDLDSENGTKLADRQIRGERVPLSPGDTVTIGSTVLMMQQLPSYKRSRRVWSHGYFLGRLEEECFKAEELQMSLAVLRLRLETAATPENVAAALGPGLRVIDVLANYGGRDFEVLLPGTAKPEADERAKKLGELLADAKRPCALGLALWSENGRTPDALLAAASEALHGRGASDRAEGEPVVADDRMREVFEVAKLAAASSANVLITGETGVGKDVVARWIHNRSRRASGPFVHVDLAAIAETVLEGELFGCEKGAFTGAVRAKAGLLESANGGTVFLNEIGELELPLQPKLLRAVQDRVVRRLGDTRDRDIDVRWIAATNKDLRAAIAQGSFRDDLFFRIAVLTLVVPPLRERPAEIEALARAFIRRFSENEGKRLQPELSTETLEILLAYHWPGNVRELANVIERALVVCQGAVIGPEHLPENVREEVRGTIGASASAEGATTATDDVEKARLVSVLEKHRWRPADAARAIGISRTTLWKRMKVLRIPLSRASRGDDP